jgi:ABC-type lipoprotein export system ATPase subunit
VVIATHERDIASWVDRRIELADGRVTSDELTQAAAGVAR